MTGRVMFCGKLGNEIQPCHMDFTARGVRRSISTMFYVGDVDPTTEKPRTDAEVRKLQWSDARKEGWRVVSVSVTECRRHRV